MFTVPHFQFLNRPSIIYLAAAMKILNDTYRHKGLRKQLIDLLRSKGIADEKVLDAMMQIPRHYFLDSALDSIAYEDRAFPIGEGQTISQPYTVAFQTELLQVKPYEKILEVGTGSAYQATILSQLGARVFTIERQKKLFDQQKEEYVFKGKYPNLKFFYGDGFVGQPMYGPFDKIIITAAAPFLPPALVTQLKVGGVMVIPENEGNSQRMKRYTKQADGSMTEEAFNLFQFVPMLQGKNNK
jgi:protein-L-isoaspartate(D-aspartate) O-methyltransferase